MDMEVFCVHYKEVQVCILLLCVQYIILQFFGAIGEFAQFSSVKKILPNVLEVIAFQNFVLHYTCTCIHVTNNASHLNVVCYYPKIVQFYSCWNKNKKIKLKSQLNYEQTSLLQRLRPSTPFSSKIRSFIQYTNRNLH